MPFLKKYLLPRIVQYIVVILIGATLVFFVPRLMPVDPVQQTLEKITIQGAFLDPDAIEQMRATLQDLYGLKGGLGAQYLTFWKRLFKGDFGPSFAQFPTPVITLIRTSLPWTLGLLVTSTILSWILGNILGGLAAYYSERKWAAVLENIAMVMRPIHYYIVALGLLMLLGYAIPLFPISGGFSIGRKLVLTWDVLLDILKHAFLPALSLVIVGTCTWFMTMRLLVSNLMAEDYIVYAQIAGVPEGEIAFKYAIRNAMLPQVTGLALSLGQIFGGALITETVFAYPGLGTLLYSSINAGDYNLMMGITLLSVIAIATGVLVMDLVYPLLDPRIRYD
ncbi:MAG: ABC transporter permease [Firmicutes bacterium]|nr:ABC transporter permease [Bacillota bacterium]